MNLFSSKIQKGEAHSKLILAGEHAVVFGEPAIAIPFPLRIRAEIESSPGEAVFHSFLYTGEIAGMPEELNGLKQCIEKSFQIVDRPLRDIKIGVFSEIPLGRGLGSSAAAATALVRGIFSFFKEKLSQEMLFSLVSLSETYAHGKPSGIDMTAVASDNFIYFKRGQESVAFTPKRTLYMVVADSGEIGDTKVAVARVKEAYLLDKKNTQNTIEAIGEVVKRVHRSILNGDTDTLGYLFNENHKQLQTLGVSTSKLDNLVEKARACGALGAKLTGGGLGGCMVALANSLEEAKDISKGLIEIGAYKSWYFSTEENKLFTCTEDKGGKYYEGYSKSKYQYCFD